MSGVSSKFFSLMLGLVLGMFAMICGAIVDQTIGIIVVVAALFFSLPVFIISGLVLIHKMEEECERKQYKSDLW